MVLLFKWWLLKKPVCWEKDRRTRVERVYFLAAFLAAGFFTDFLGVEAFFAGAFFAGFLAAGFFAAVFLGVEAFFAGAFFVALVGFLAAGFLAVVAFFAAGFLAAGFLAAGFFAAGFLAAGFLAAGFFSTLTTLKDPLAPTPLVWLSLPLVTILFRLSLI